MTVSFCYRLHEQIELDVFSEVAHNYLDIIHHTLAIAYQNEVGEIQPSFGFRFY